MGISQNLHAAEESTNAFDLHACNYLMILVRMCFTHKTLCRLFFCILHGAISFSKNYNEV